MARPGGRGLRIIGGEHRGARLVTPAGRILRPMRDQVREALFSILGPDATCEASVLDLFAGSGSLGLEALSRGAARALFIDKAPQCLRALEQNVAKLGLEERATVRRYDLSRGLKGLPGPFDLVLVHPPFELLRRPPGPKEPDVSALLAQLGGSPKLVRPGGRVAFETPRACFQEPTSIPDLEVLVRREYGSTALFVCQPKRAADPDGSAEE